MATTDTTSTVPSAPTRVGEVPEAESGRRGYYLEIFAVSFAGLLLEIAYTRIISFKLFYYYTYLVIGLALLGIGCGGVIVALSRRLRAVATETILVWSMLLGAVGIGVGYLVVARVPLDTFAIWHYRTSGSFENLARLFGICLALFAPFIAVGVVISTLFGRRPERIGRLYFFDLVGAGLACALVVYLILWVGPVFAVFLAGLLLATAALRLSIGARTWVVGVAIVVTALLAIGVLGYQSLPDAKVESTKQVPQHALYSKWSPIFRVDVENTSPLVRVLFHDGLPGSAIYRWDGSKLFLDKYNFDSDVRAIPFAVLDGRPRQELIIGAAGGHEVLASLYFDARHMDAVELNPVTYDLVKHKYAAFDGHIADNPRVNYVNGDGRTYLARSDKKYDLVWYPAPDSYAATNASTAGAFVLSESYLYTSNAVKDSLEHLAPGGILATQFGEVNYDAKPNRTSRYVSTSRHALAGLGIRDPKDHILVATSPTALGATALSTILVKREAFTPDEVNRFAQTVARVPGSTLRYAPGRQSVPTKPSELITAPPSQLDSIYSRGGYEVSPITDDGPFFWHFRPFPEVLRNYAHSLRITDREDTVGERVLILLLGVAAILAAVFLLLPFVTIRKTWLRLPHKTLSAVYFAALGFGFIFFEVTLIQRLTLFLGYPTYSLTVTLASLLIFVGIGALLSGKVDRTSNALIGGLGVAIAALTLFYLFGLPALTNGLLDQALAVRVVTAFVVLAPLGVCLGMFMPIGLGAVAQLDVEHEREYVAWGWAVNGFASVIGSVLSTILAMSFGFHVVLVVALAIYAVALMALRLLVRSAGVIPAA